MVVLVTFIFDICLILIWTISSSVSADFRERFGGHIVRTTEKCVIPEHWNCSRHLDSGSTWYSSDLNKDHHGNWPRWQEIWYLESNYCNLTQSFQTKSKPLSMYIAIFIFENLFDFLSYYSNQVLLSVNMSNIMTKWHDFCFDFAWGCMWSKWPLNCLTFRLWLTTSLNYNVTRFRHCFLHQIWDIKFLILHRFNEFF